MMRGPPIPVASSRLLGCAPVDRATPAQPIASPLPVEAAVHAVTPLRRLRAWLAAGPAYPPDARDLRTIDVLGLRLPVRATLAVLVVTALVMLDHSDRILGPFWDGTGTIPELLRARALSRAVVMGGGALLVIVLLFRDSPRRYGLRLGDVRAGVALGLTGVALMTPVVLAVVQLPDFRAYYAPAAATSSLDVVLTSAIELLPVELFFRGLLMFALLRVIGPLGVVLATLPFAFGHLGKPELETLSTVIGGTAYGWLDGRTGSVLWSGLTHVTIVSMAVLLSGVVAPG
jgi:membrane protease YdiL (CAAX protease family)